ncbi:MAG TPA: hypothetical protein PK010_08580 [Alphaproteobacteria bacterium]|nr:hypothetical protein [Alphaproteobacteria bacterium]
MYKNLVIVGSLIVSSFSNLSAMMVYEDPMNESKDAKSMPVVQVTNYETDSHVAATLFSSEKESDVERAFDIYFTYYGENPEIAAFFNELDPQILTYIEKKDIKNAKTLFLNARKIISQKITSDRSL